MPSALMPLLAILAGVLSFTSPCCLPLLPSYVSYISALPTSDLDGPGSRAVTMRAAVLFVAGFTLVFTLLGVGASLAGAAVVRQLPLVVRVAGIVIIVMGLSMAGLLRVPFINREHRFSLNRLPTGPRGAFAVGLAFAAGWTPCIGPVLATILTMAAAARSVGFGALLLLLYSIGLGLPFVLLALFLNRARSSVTWLRRHGRAIETTGGLLLVGVGVLFVSGAWRSFFLPLQRYFAHFGWPPL